MTMLDRMRRHRNWLKWSLGLVCLAFVIFYIPDFLRGTGADAAGTDSVASVERPPKSDRRNSVARTRRSCRRTARRTAPDMSEQLLKQLGVDQQILQQMVDERAALAEAERLNIQVTDDEVAKRIASYSRLPAERRFRRRTALSSVPRVAAAAADRRRVRGQHPPSADSRQAPRRRHRVDDGGRPGARAGVPPAQREGEAGRRHGHGRQPPQPGERAGRATSLAHFEAHKEDFKIPEKRKIRYLLVDLDAIRAEDRRATGRHRTRLQRRHRAILRPEQVRASHILLKTEGKDDAAVKAQAEDLLKQAKGGADFAALAKKYSEDDSNAKNGGDLDYFGRGRMVPEFDAVAFAMEPGQISDLVKTQYGYHIIKVVEKKPGTTQEARRGPRADQRSDRQSAGPDASRGYCARSSRPRSASRGSRHAGRRQRLSRSRRPDSSRVTNRSWLSVARPKWHARVRTDRGRDVRGDANVARFVFFAVSGNQDGYVPKFDEVKDRVRDALIATRARTEHAEKAAELAAKLKGGGDFVKAAKAAGVEAKTTDFITRDAPIPDLGNAPEVLDTAFELPAGRGQRSDRHRERDRDRQGRREGRRHARRMCTANKDTFREQVLNDRRNRFFSGYLLKAKQKMKIDVNREALQRVVGYPLPV